MRSVLLCLFAALALVLALFQPEQDNHGFQFANIALCAIAASVFFLLRNRHAAHIWLTASFLFSLSYSIAHLNLPILRLVGIEVIMPIHSFIWSNEDVYNRSVSTSVCGLVFFFLGATISERSSHFQVSHRTATLYKSSFVPVLAASSFLLFLASSGSFILGYYTGTNASPVASYWYKLFKIAFSAYIIIKVTNYFQLRDRITGFRQYLGHLGIPLLALLISFIVIFLRAGDRAPILYFLLLTFGPYLASSSRLGNLRAISLGVVAMFALSVIGTVRQARFSGASLYDRLGEILPSSSILHNTSFMFDRPILFGHTLELAASIRALNHVLSEVPDQYDYGHGTFALSQIASVVPGLGGFVNSLLFGGDSKMDGSANFVTYLIQGQSPTSGDGTTVTADLYLDFGLLGVIVGLFLFGLFIGRFEGKLRSGSQSITFVWVCILAYFANSIYLPRSSLLLELSNAVLSYVLIMLATRRWSVAPASLNTLQKNRSSGSG
jgi:hypothetical protein